MQAMRSGRAAATTAILLALAVLLMHLGMPLMAMAPATASPTGHHGAPRDAAAADEGGTAADRAEHGQTVQKQTVDAVHDHEAHDCAGTVVVHKSVGAPSLVAVLPFADGAPDTSAATHAALARGSPPWTVFDLSQLCVLRV
ncbi:MULTISPECIES: hypothetical protein [Tsukamurella]|uniref:Uncharacterized protein n=2 Tax=Tsukamurella TaxID=2060 RepID=A0A5C5S210_9ACTN|nr:MULTISPECIES: hypothetical protein [Tsukamurella]NMD54148.1 hypothetical protein [Tsukamurella columbiensis]TWS28321.1 hypothetical protein FK530_14725 [Tsukamurella conjunctivitidis]